MVGPTPPKERAEQMVLLQGESSEAFEWFKIDRAIGNVRNQVRAVIEPTGQMLDGGINAFTDTIQ